MVIYLIRGHRYLFPYQNFLSFGLYMKKADTKFQILLILLSVMAVLSSLNCSLLSVKSLAGLKELNQSLLNGDANTLETNAVLKQFRNDLKVNLCSLMDRSGKTISSSNLEEDHGSEQLFH